MIKKSYSEHCSENMLWSLMGIRVQGSEITHTYVNRIPVLTGVPGSVCVCVLSNLSSWLSLGLQHTLLLQ